MSSEKHVNRRDFAKTTLAAGAAGMALSNVLATEVAAESTNAHEIPPGAKDAPAGAKPAAAAGPAGAAKSYPNGWREGTTIPACTTAGSTTTGV